MVSLKTIAADLGVSHALVSRVLNNRMGTTGVSAKTRARILQRAKELGYRPNPLALALREGRRGAVGVCVHGVGVKGSDLVLRFIEGIGNALSADGQHLLFHYFEAQKDFEATCNQALVSKVDGLIIGGMAFPWMMNRLTELKQAGVPIVLACHGPVGKEFVNYQVDPEQQGYIAAQHLIEIGCRRIAHLHALDSRYNGYRRALSEAGISLDKRLVVQIPGPDYFVTQAGYDAAVKLLDSGVEFDAIQAQSDAQAVGVQRCLIERGIPRDRWPKLTGVDDSPIASEYALVPLTSVTAEMDTCAHMAAAALQRMLQGEKAESQRVQPRLVVRESTVP